MCSATWKELSLLAVHQNQNPDNSQADKTSNNSHKKESQIRDVKNKCLRVYNDDEPLMSPTCGARFNSIPESDENEEDENGAIEFQGFFVNSAPSSSPMVNGRIGCDEIVGDVGGFFS
ncbi:hypothetical protein CJ030_MR1G023917 [Morella rubra]|uniref:Uncharacterized protein n=1 Tax=Morella rubra TaxID=262757 RepID=A0A6A1WLV5_9ROSI|nr:hypothetical protein CJ030_MR1G023917 [Morella rubra]